MPEQSSALFERIQQNLRPQNIRIIVLDIQFKIINHAKKQENITHRQEENHSISYTEIKEMMEVEDTEKAPYVQERKKKTQSPQMQYMQVKCTLSKIKISLHGINNRFRHWKNDM